MGDFVQQVHGGRDRALESSHNGDSGTGAHGGFSHRSVDPDDRNPHDRGEPLGRSADCRTGADHHGSSARGFHEPSSQPLSQFVVHPATVPSICEERRIDHVSRGSSRLNIGQQCGERGGVHVSGVKEADGHGSSPSPCRRSHPAPMMPAVRPGVHLPSMTRWDAPLPRTGAPTRRPGTVLR